MIPSQVILTEIRQGQCDLCQGMGVADYVDFSLPELRELPHGLYEINWLLENYGQVSMCPHCKHQMKN